MANQQKILQTGLYTKDQGEAEQFIKRVTRFNAMNLGNPVKLDVLPYENGDEFVPDPHYKFRLLFPSKGVQRAFWSE